MPILDKASIDQFLVVFNTQISDAEGREPDMLKRSQVCIQICSDTLTLLHQQVALRNFSDQSTEIHFFKHVKPQVLAKKFFYRKLLELFSNPLCITNAQMKELFEQKVKDFTNCLVGDKAYYEYMHMEAKDLDEKYFLRERHNPIFCRSDHCDPQFCTNADCVIADVIAYIQLIAFCNAWLNEPAGISGQLPSAKKPTLPCKLSTTSLVELGYAFYACRAFGPASIKEVMNYLATAFQTDLSGYYETFRQIKERKQGPVKFLDELKTNLIRYIDQSDQDAYP